MYSSWMEHAKIPVSNRADAKSRSGELAGRGRGPPARAPAPPATSSSGLGLLVVPRPPSSATGHLSLRLTPPSASLPPSLQSRRSP